MIFIQLTVGRLAVASLLAALVAARVAGVCAQQPDLASLELLILNANTWLNPLLTVCQKHWKESLVKNEYSKK